MSSIILRVYVGYTASPMIHRGSLVIAATLAIALGCAGAVRRTPLIINDRAAPARVEVTYTDDAPLVADIPVGERVRLTVYPLKVEHIQVTSDGEQLLFADTEKIQDTRDRLARYHIDAEAWLIKDNGVWPLTREQLRGYDEKTGQRRPSKRPAGAASPQ